MDNPAPFGRFPHEKDREKEVIVGRFELDLKKEKTQLRDRKGARHFKELCVAD
ncbi:sporulation sigma factor SigK [Bacillus amyloliquefaciens]|nr:sporulation sigma factor SigK [Bacillus amyloliquefaciens]